MEILCEDSTYRLKTLIKAAKIVLLLDSCGWFVMEKDLVVLRDLVPNWASSFSSLLSVSSVQVSVETRRI